MHHPQFKRFAIAHSILCNTSKNCFDFFIHVLVRYEQHTASAKSQISTPRTSRFLLARTDILLANNSPILQGRFAPVNGRRWKIQITGDISCALVRIVSRFVPFLRVMTTSTKLSGSSLSPRPPAKGSFPLDHLSECREFSIAYQSCLDKHSKKTSACRKQARAYLQCRMERGLMATEEWDKLGLSKDSVEGVKSSTKETKGERAEEEGFVAGARTAKRKTDRFGGRRSG